ncbi:MAG: hydrogenase iron-sulfur subunit [Nitrospiraceae bacterium]|nr:hydrogenase iron-sulfur subunit [Nitrospiraceae bacterium]
MKAGLFISEGDGAISGVIDVRALEARYDGAEVVRVLDNLHCAASLRLIAEEVRNRKLDAVVLAGESPLFYSRTRNGGRILEMLQGLDINANRIGIVNLREQVSIPHAKEPVEATKKAKVLIDVAMEKVRVLRDVGMIEVAPKRTVAVIGSQPGGFFTAMRLLERGFHILFIDHRPVPPEGDFLPQVIPTIASVKNHPDVKFYSAGITDLYGYAGNFRIKLGGDINLRAGGIVVSIGDDAEYAGRLYPYLRIERDSNGHFRNVMSDTAVTETVNPGIFLIPPGPHLSHTIASADSAAMSLDALLSKNSVNHELFVSEVDQEVCGGCGTCIKTCIFKASEIDQVTKLSSTNIKRCVGCGNCVSACPTGARDQVSATTKYLMSAIGILSGYEPPNGIKVLYLACEGCGYPSLDYAGKEGIEYATSVMPLSVKCAGRIDTQLILEAFRRGFRGVVICKCSDDHCLNIVGNLDLDRRANLFRAVLGSRGISPERLRIFGVTSCEGGSCVANAMDFINHLKTLEATA